MKELKAVLVRLGTIPVGKYRNVHFPNPNPNPNMLYIFECLMFRFRSKEKGSSKGLQSQKICKAWEKCRETLLDNKS